MRLNRSALLLLGDAAVLVLFAITGRRTHEEAVGLAAAGEVLMTAAPFVLAWVVATLALGAVSHERTASMGSMVRWTLVAWVLAAPLAMLFRALLLGRPSPLSFYLVAGAVPLALLLGWRLAFSLLERRAGSPRGVAG